MATQVTTAEVRLSYCNLHEPRANESGVEKYSVAILIPKSDTETIEKIRKAIDTEIQTAKATLFGNSVKNLKTALRDGDEEKDDPVYAGYYFLNASANLDRKPLLFNERREPADRWEIYSGCYARVSLDFYPYNKNGNRGVGVGINSVLKTRDGEALGSTYTAAQAAKDFGFDDLM